MTVEDSRSAPAVARAAAVTRLLIRSTAPLGVNAIARELGLVPSTCLHVLRALSREGLVAIDPETRRYVLGMEILTLARRLLRQNRFTAVVQPCLDTLAAAHRLTALGITLEVPEHMVVVALARSSAAVIHVEIGSRLPILLSATGRCYAAVAGMPPDAGSSHVGPSHPGPSHPGSSPGWPPHELRRRFDALRWDRPPAWADWLREVEAARRDGYAVDRGNNIRGVTVLAAPVFDRPGRMAHAIALLLMSDQLDDVREGDIAADLLRAAAAASERLGGQSA